MQSPSRSAVDGVLASSRIDPAMRYGSFGVRWVLRQRLKWACDALPGDRFATVLEIGYGKGAFMHELAKHASHVCGSDVHEHGAEVRQRLTRQGVIPHLVRSSSDTLPFREGAFDAVVIVSALEQLRDPGRTLREAVRVVLPGGAVVCVAPRVLRWRDRLETLLGTERDSEVHDGRVRVQAALADRSLRAERSLRPRHAPKFLAPYEVVILRRLPVHAGRSAGPTVEVTYSDHDLAYDSQYRGTELAAAEPTAADEGLGGNG